MKPPTLAQERGLSIAPLPFAIISFLSSCRVIHHLLWEDKERHKLRRLYHRLILALNIALLPFSFVETWRPFAVPEGTMYNPLAMGTIYTCSAQGFIELMCILAIPIYYGSLSLQAYMAIKNNFNEEKYKWIEKWVHLVAVCIPCALSAIVAARENFNPTVGGCFLAKAPIGCESDPDVPCERGKGIKYLELIVGLGLLLLYFVIPPAITASMYCWINRLQRSSTVLDCSSSSNRMMGGMHRIRESARKTMMQSAVRQIALYLISFWFTWIFGLITQAYRILSDGDILYNLVLFGRCVYNLQGFIFAMVYFTLQRLGMGTSKIEVVMSERRATSTCRSRRSELTVGDIRSNAARNNNGRKVSGSFEDKKFDFNIFDGVPDKDSPWAKFIDVDSDDDSDDNFVEDTTNGDLAVRGDTDIEMKRDSTANSSFEEVA